MGTIIFLLFPLCFLAMTSHAFDSPQTYWTSKLPNTPIPQLIEDSLVTPGVGLTLEPSTPRKFLQSANDESTLKTIIEAYIGTYCNKRFLSSISNNHLSHHKKGIGKIESLGRKQFEVREVNDLKESLIPKNFVELYSKQQPEISTNVQLETTVSNDLKESLIPKNLIQLYSKQQPESKETDSLSDSPISTNVQLETTVSNDLKESLIPKNLIQWYSKQQPESKETDSDSPISTNVQLETTVSNDLKESLIPKNLIQLYDLKESLIPKNLIQLYDLKESLIPKNLIQLYSKQQPESKETDSLSDSPISTNVQLETTVSNDLKESLIPKNLIQLYSKQQPESKETDSLSDSPISTNVQLETTVSNDLKESLIPKNLIQLYSKQQPESKETDSLSDSPISTNVQLETTVSNDLKESLIPKNLIQLYSKQQPESKETDSLSDSPISTNVQPEAMVSNDLKESLISKNFVNVYSKQQPEAMKSSDLRMSSLPNPLTLNSNEQHKRVTMHNHDVSKSEEGELVFVEEDLHVGKTFKLHFRKGEYNNPFLPRDVAVKIPFSSGTLQDTLNLLSVSPNSVQSKVIAEKMALCEEGPIEGLEKQCVTSLESMVDFVVSNLGENVRTVFTKVEQDYPKMEYRVTQVKRLTKNDHETIACHKMEYPYALYFCHGTLTLRPYMVTLLAKDGTEIQAVASCHKETTDPLKNFMKNVLKVMPGSTRICHILTTQDNLFWVIN